MSYVRAQVRLRNEIWSFSNCAARQWKGGKPMSTTLTQNLTHDFLAVRNKELEAEVGRLAKQCDEWIGMYHVLQARESVLSAENSALRAEVERLTAERDEFKESYRLALVSVNHAYDKGRAAMLAEVKRLMGDADQAHREYDETWYHLEQSVADLEAVEAVRP